MPTAAEAMRSLGGATGLFSLKTTGTGGPSLHRSPPFPCPKSEPATQTLPLYLSLCVCLHSPHLPQGCPQEVPRHRLRPVLEPGCSMQRDLRTDLGSLYRARARAQSTCFCVMLHPSSPHTASAISAQARGDHVFPEPSTGPATERENRSCQTREKYFFQILNTIPGSDSLDLINVVI